MMSHNSHSRWIWGLFFLPILLLLFSAYRLNKVVPPFFAPDEGLHFLLAVKDESSPPVQNGVFQCSPLSEFVRSIRIEDYYLEKSKRFLGWDYFNESNAEAIADECGKYLAHQRYVESYSYPQVLLSRWLLFGNTPTSELDKLQIRQLYLLSRVTAFVFTLIILLFAFIRFYIEPSSINFLAYFAGLVLIAIPINFQQMMSISSDVSMLVGTFGLGLLLVRSEIPSHLNRTHQKVFFWVERIYILGFIFFATMTKAILIGVIIGALAHFVLKNKGTKNWKIDFVSWVLIFICVATFVKGVFFYLKGIDAGNPNFANPVLQKQFILEHPFRAANAIVRSTFGRMFGIYDATLAWLSYRTPLATKVISYLVFIAWILIVRKLRLPKSQTSVSVFKSRGLEFFIVFSGIFIFNFLTGLAMYIAHTPVGDVRVSGLQARYFAPLWIAGLFYFLAVSRHRLKVSDFNLKTYAFITAAFGMLISIEIFVLEKSILRDFWN